MPNDLIRATGQRCLQPTSALTMDLHQATAFS